MRKYSEHQPTGFDRKGAFLDDQQDWLVLPIGQTRDSDCLERSNFTIALEMLGDESETVEVHRFGHWGPGWYEIIIIDPKDKDKVKIAEDIETSLADYPVLNEEHFSDLEWTEASDYWERMDLSERICYCDRHKVSIFASRSDCIPEDIYASDLLAP